jgi:hypothetical protein
VKQLPIMLQELAGISGADARVHSAPTVRNKGSRRPTNAT